MPESKTIFASERSKEEINEMMRPLVKAWFYSKFKELSVTQKYGVMPIWERRNILISAPTGGTKTLTAFLSILNYLVSLAEKNELEDKVYCVYCSPLKALTRDIFKNLIEPLEEIKKIAEQNGKKLQEIRIALRTGDTTADEKQKQMKKMPHILVTTPETLAIVLNAPKFSLGLKAVEFVIVDEIHALANKRGVHLLLSLERLEEMSKISPVRIGLSATISPLEEIAKFLTGNRDCLIADVELDKKMDIGIECIDGLEEGIEINKEIYGLIDKLIEKHKTTLIFTNTRAGTERVIHHLKERFPGKYAENIGAHHSSLSREHRFDIEDRLRKGELKVVVSSTSLELGLDIGYIDLVILLGSPKSTARALQRCGRSGHMLHASPKARFVVLDRDDLVECSVMMKEIIERKIDSVQVPKNCLDVLSQQIYGMAISRIWDVKEMFALIKKSYCYKELKYEDFLSVLSYLAGEYALEHRNVYAKIWYDEKEGKIGKKGKLARVIYMTNVGTIPDESFVSVVLASDKTTKIGMIDEAFLERMKKGDIFVLGGKRYEFVYSMGMKAFVKGSVNKPPTIPSWYSEMLPLNFELALEIGRFRRLVEEKMKKKAGKEEIIEFIEKFCYVNGKSAGKIYEHLHLQNKSAGIPHDKKIVVEKYGGEREYWLFHSLFGRRVNDALSRAIAFCIGRIGGRDIEIGINDNGFYLIGEKIDKEKINKAIEFLTSNNLEEVLKEIIERTEIFKRRFRHCAARSLMILRNYKGRKKTAGRQQVSSSLLMYAIEKMSKEFPIMKEARREIFEEVMDIKNAKLVLDWIEDGKIKIEHKESNIPSPFSLNLIIQGRADLIKIEDKVEFLRRVYEEIRKKSS